MKKNHCGSMSRVLRLALPVAGSRLLSTLMGFVGVILLSRYNTISLAASALISTTQVILISAGMATIFSTSILVGQYFGRQQFDKIEKTLQQAMLLSVLISLLLIAIFWFIAPLLRALRQPEDIITVVEQYFQVFCFGVPAILILTAIQQTLFAIQKQFVALMTDLLSLVLTTVLSICLIYGKLGCPELGVSGLAAAIVIQAWLLTLGLFAYLKMCSPLFKTTFKIDKQLLLKLLHLGWPISVCITGEILSLFAIAIMAGWLGFNALKAIQVTSQYLLLLVIPIFGISQAISILTSHLLGANQGHLLKPFGNSALKLGYALISFAFIIVTLFPKTLIAVFIDINNTANQNTIHQISILLVVIVLGQVFDLLRNICAGALRAMNFTLQPMIISILYLWLFSLPLAYILGFKSHFGLIGILSAYDLGMLLAGITLYQFWLKKSAIYTIDSVSNPYFAESHSQL